MMLNTYIFKDSFVDTKMDYTKVQAATEKEATDIYKVTKGIKRLKMTTKVSEYEHWKKVFKQDIEFNKGLKAKQKQVDLSKKKLDYVESLKAIN